jgi:hypothetical protein
MEAATCIAEHPENKDLQIALRVQLKKLLDRDEALCNAIAKHHRTGATAIDCAMNAGAIVVTSNTRDFQKARESLGLSVITPTELVIKLAT